jgi:hypothetical protein
MRISWLLRHNKAAHWRVATPEGGERIESSGFLGEGWKSGNLGLCRAAD